ncbi:MULTISPECIES: response regulator [unclassified Flavobacterium]|uniref:response regulator n=1 Tax=unclassified Flavobacterium TaxID=196869 RepID=UPI00131ADC5D|nr:MULTISPECIES: response regulator [unclassified Flavobacterium]
MKKTLNILIVDDHPMTVDSYINLLLEADLYGFSLNFIKCYNCKGAYEAIIFHLKKNVNIDLALIDLNLPPYKDFNINSGSDLASLIKRKGFECKIILLTMHSEPLIVDKITKEINPEGFISKSDINFELFPIICKKIIEGDTYRSPSIDQALKELYNRNINWDIHDIQILTLLSQGIKTVNLSKYIPLSISAIEKRKANIKDQILLGKGTDEELISIANKLGII